MVSSNDVEGDVHDTIRDVLDLDDEFNLDTTMTASDVPGWDSTNHVLIMLGLERRLGFKWADEEITSVKNIGDLVDIIRRKMS